MRSIALSSFFGLVVLIMAATNMVGIRSMLQYAPDMSSVPVLQFAMNAAGRDPLMLQPALRVVPRVVARHLVNNQGVFAISVPMAAGEALGFIDRLEETGDQRGMVSGWAFAPDDARRIGLVGVWVDGASQAAVVPAKLRPDVDAALGRKTGRSGFDLTFDMRGSKLCNVGIFAIDDILQMSWIREPGVDCE